MAVGAVEPQFFAAFSSRLGLDRRRTRTPTGPGRLAPAMRRRFAEVFAARGRDEWCALLGGTEACATPVLTFAEAPHHPHLASRGTYVEAAGGMQAAPAPRFSRSTVTGPGGPTSSTTVPDLIQRWTAPPVHRGLGGGRPRCPVRGTLSPCAKCCPVQYLATWQGIRPSWTMCSSPWRPDATRRAEPTRAGRRQRQRPGPTVRDDPAVVYEAADPSAICFGSNCPTSRKCIAVDTKRPPSTSSRRQMANISP